MPLNPLRLLICLRPGPAQQAALARHCAEWRWAPGTRTTRAPRLHLTLHGPWLVHPDLAPQLQRALRHVAQSPLALVLDTPAAWAHGLAVLQPDAASRDALAALHRCIAVAVGRTSLAPARWGRPHVTLSRNAAGALAPAACRPVIWPGHEFVLLHSPPYAQDSDLTESFLPMPTFPPSGTAATPTPPPAPAA